MKLGTRIFFCYLIIFILCFSYPINWILDNLRTRYLEGVEEPLVDQANILAAMVGREMEAGQFNPETWHLTVDYARSRSFSAKIYHLVKTDVDMRIYITDAAGKLIFDSQNKKNIGTDYTTWRDVYLTLEGKYGARTTPDDIADPASKVLYVAAPVLVNEKIAGVLTVGKPTTSINTFINKAKPQILKVGVLSMAAALVLSYFVSLWITRPIKRLTCYANDIRYGRRAALPKLDRSEIGEMGNAFAKMQETLEGKKYVEQYVQKLTHEVKSPLSAIRGAAELLQEKMQPEQRARFFTNIRQEANRIQALVDRMLELSALENQKILQKVEPISISDLIQTVVESKGAILEKKQIRLTLQIADNVKVQGDRLLLYQAIANLVQNAIDFSPARGQIQLRSQTLAEDVLKLMVEDHGVGIPEYATVKVFDKFFSLQRPDSGNKSTGLGLNFVQEVTILHNGEIKLENRSQKGVRATLSLPMYKL
ncbi:MAG: two-component system sensor histidine kinase CreC [Desulfobacterales bacterium]|nr:two-component system sensor histidine kinase CreC [Desulfobacterales bacterium]